MDAAPGATGLLRVAALAVALAVGGCADAGGGPGARQAASAARLPAPAPASAAQAVVAPGAVSVSPPAEFGRYPALAAAVEAAAADARQAFEADARAAAARGENVGGWTLRVEWRVLRNNRYLWLAEGEGEAVRGAGHAAPVHLRLVYDGIGKQVLAFEDWFAPEAWPGVVDTLRAQVPPARHPSSAEDWRTVPYEPIHRPEGQVMRFDLLLPAEDGREPLRVRVPREAVEAAIAIERRTLLDATAAGP